MLEKITEELKDFSKLIEENKELLKYHPIFSSKIIDTINAAQKLAENLNLKDNIDFERITHYVKYINSTLKSDEFDNLDLAKMSEKAIELANYGMPFPFNEKYADILNADINDEYVKKICKKYSDGENFTQIIKSLDNFGHKKKQQIKEIVSCFKNEEYLACSSIIFEMIERELISSQSRKKGKKRKSFDKGMVQKNIEEIKNAQTEERKLNLCIKINMLTLFEKLFKSGNDFIEEDKIINRNFISHGMNERDIKRDDCVKLFLFLYYFMETKSLLIN